ncbi:MAG: hypothetical protein K2K87_05555, partial [Lachnospiraceae bacterium]|nr:hypothetical protein [Lachnospiraceae bacterium]
EIRKRFRRSTGNMIVCKSAMTHRGGKIRVEKDWRIRANLSKNPQSGFFRGLRNYLYSYFFQENEIFLLKYRMVSVMIPLL